jgi:hypothetical protein
VLFSAIPHTIETVSALFSSGSAGE